MCIERYLYYIDFTQFTQNHNVCANYSNNYHTKIIKINKLTVKNNKKNLVFANMMWAEDGGECLACEICTTLSERRKVSSGGTSLPYVDTVAFAVDVKSVQKCTSAGLNTSSQGKKE
ncbi:hypothetical protein RF11_13416 [Thelohanellus kitauei]|uniref:Uncharacterized protein n=1 Tax=Thelohanellus kitauei TaxID=669202 RepID=A0A0C2N030_THEKT|nr:hypothetical protein RF11_13416 [Thelohanellus kitauei]